MSSYAQTCHCGHDIDTHHEKHGSCLAARCECPTYRDKRKADTYRAPRVMPMHASWCRCYDCMHGGRPA